MLLLLVMFSLLPGHAVAQDTILTLPQQADVRIVVDISGSMKETDPGNLRRPAVRLLARMLPTGSEAGLWTFGQYVNMLVPFGAVDDAWRNTMIERSEQINSVALHTNLGLALEKASDDWLSGGTLENTHIIVLSDGMVDIPGGNTASRREERRILETLLPTLKAKGATIHTVGLSELADVNFLRRLARETGGSFQLAQTAEALNLAFADALNTAVPQEQIPIEGDGFVVDEGVKEFTALIFSGKDSEAASDLALAVPDGEPFTADSVPGNVRWAVEPGYDLITVTEPSAGRWRIVGDLGQGSRVTVVSDLRMVVSPIPTEFSEESPFNLDVAFFEEAERLVSADFLQVMQVRLSITANDGRRGTKVLSADQPPEDGVYRDTVTRLPAPGRYQIDVVADGGTFSRRFSAMTSFTLPGEEPVLEVVSEPLVPDLRDQVEMPIADQPEQEREPVPEPAPEPLPDTAAPEPVNDVADAEPEPVIEAEGAREPEQGAFWGLPVWLWGAGAALFVAIVGFGLFAYRQKKARSAAEQAAAASRETLDDLPEDEELVPVVAATVEDEEPEPEPEPKTGEGSEILEEDIPLADDTVVDEPEDEPVQSKTAPEPEPEPEPEDDEDEFGLEDFDLSEFDDLPDSEDEDTMSEADGQDLDKSEADDSDQHDKDQKK
ncbi:vWA domain-containing protein [Marinobacter sp.]|uniref:vWA domain-containing protein n=1 Tax=Marinobacter sp. TaxID=50741 RepID=UPI0025C35D11|nr:vWA domain-containing protein [Marinobacter sp.]